MTGDPPVLDRPALWAALCYMRIHLPDGEIQFEEALAAEQVWPFRFAARVTEEYRRFLYLAATAGSEVTPSQAVDEAWHLHLALPHYREILCDRILRRTLEHRPATGEPEDEERCQRQYEETLALYERVFGLAPPRDVWPRPAGADEHEEEDEAQPPGPGGDGLVGRRVAIASLVAGVAAFPLGAPIVGAVFLGAALVLWIAFQPVAALARGDGGGGCGGSCGGSSSSGDDCGSSCGGSSCGGGGCGGGCGGD